MATYTGEVSVKVTVDVEIEAESQADAERIAGQIYGTASCPEGVIESGEFSDLVSVVLFNADE